jgi:cobalamin-dependent methionine synthase I
MSVPLLSIYTQLGHLQSGPQPSQHDACILVVTVPGDTHYWGSYLISILLTHAGYRVLCQLQCSADTFRNMIDTELPACIIITSLLTSARPFIEELIHTIPQNASQLPIILGGFGLDPDWIMTSLESQFPQHFYYAKDANRVLEILSKC